MKMKQTFLTVAALCSAGLLSAADFRIDISGERSKVEMEIKEVGESIRGEGAGWLGERKNQRLIFSGPASAKWETKTFSFLPKTNGSISLCLMGTINKPGAPLLAYDDVRINGQPVKNGSFEEGEGDKIAVWGGWGKAKRMNDGGTAGQHYVLANHVNALAQTIPVKAGEKVTISFQVKNEK